VVPNQATMILLYFVARATVASCVLSPIFGEEEGHGNGPERD
jgi:hypothetical protein